MSVLSDTTLRHGLATLVPNGEKADAKHCAYEFTAATVFKGSAANPQAVVAGAPVIIEPTELVWVKAKEEIKMPRDRVGLWVQTHTLSKKGLLLLNTTLIEPGYAGPLHAVFVNFGQTRVTIDSTTKIAKVIFFELDTGATELVNIDTSSYDKSILDISANAPDSFMRLRSFVTDLKSEANARIEELKKEARALQTEVAISAKNDLMGELDKHKNELRAEKEKQTSAMTEGVKSAAIRWWGPTILGFFAALAGVWLGLAVYLPRVTASYGELDGLAKRAVQEHAAALDKASAEFRTSRVELDRLQEEFQTLQRQNAAIEKRLEASGRRQP